MAAIPPKYNSAEKLYQGSSDYPPVECHVKNTESKSKDPTFFESTQRKFLQFGTFLAKLKLETVAFLWSVSFVLTKTTSTTMILHKVCAVHFHYPAHICDNLNNFTGKSAVEKLTTNYQLAHIMIQILPAAILACFIGPWSDRYGRKLPLILAVIGMILDAVGSTVCAHFLDTRVEYYLIAAIFTGIFGGPVSILAVIYSYASDLTPLAGRTMKYAFLEMAFGLANPIGATAGGWMAELMGFAPVFFYSAAGFTLSLICVIFLLEETRGLDNDDSWSMKMRELFSCKSFKEGFVSTVKKRPHNGRTQVILLIATICCLVIAMASTGPINYLYAYHQLGWGNAEYSTITSIYSVLGTILLIFVVPLLKRFKVGDPVLGLVGAISLFAKNLGISVAWKAGIYHLGSLLGLLGGFSVFSARSLISKVVSTEDIGKVFSFVASAEFLLPVLTSILLTQTFNAFLDTFPGMPYLLIAVFLLLPFGTFSWLCCLPKMGYEDISHIRPSKEVLFASNKTEKINLKK